MNPLQLLRSHISQFAPLTDADWELLAPHIIQKTLKKHELFSKEGRRANEVGFVLEGVFRQYYLVDGEEKTTWFFFEHDLLCSYISCITKQPSLISIEALTPATYLSFPYKLVEELYAININWQTFGRHIAEYVAIGLEDRMVSLLTLKPEERYRRLLNGQNKKIIEQIPQQYIANFLGITPVSMSRIRSRFYKK